MRLTRAAFLTGSAATIGATPAEPRPAAAASDLLTILQSEPPRSMDPADHTATTTASVLSPMYEGLTRFDETLQAKPSLATEWTRRRRRPQIPVQAPRRRHLPRRHQTRRRRRRRQLRPPSRPQARPGQQRPLPRRHGRRRGPRPDDRRDHPQGALSRPAPPARQQQRQHRQPHRRRRAQPSAATPSATGPLRLRRMGHRRLRPATPLRRLLGRQGPASPA